MDADLGIGSESLAADTGGAFTGTVR